MIYIREENKNLLSISTEGNGDVFVSVRNSDYIGNALSTLNTITKNEKIAKKAHINWASFDEAREGSLDGIATIAKVATNLGFEINLPKVMIVDLHNVVHRAFYAGANTLSAFKNTLSLFKGKIDFLVAASEGNNSHEARKAIYPEYKAKSKEKPEALVKALRETEEFITSKNIPLFKVEGFEADDIIAATVNKLNQFGLQSIIVTTDKDMNQLLHDGLVSCYNPAKGKFITAKSFKDEYGFSPALFVDYLAITGDTSDNVPGVAGIGDKGARELVSKWGTLDNIYKNISSIPNRLGSKMLENREMAYLSRELVDLSKFEAEPIIKEALNFKNFIRKEIF